MSTTIRPATARTSALGPVRCTCRPLTRPAGRAGHGPRCALTRRRLLAGGMAGLGLLAAGCSPSGEPAASPSTGPRRIEHAYGVTEVPDDAERIVVLGYTDIEVALALGVVPVGYTDFFGSGLNEWAAPLAGNATPESWELTDGMPLERILSLAPDLVIASDALQRADYDQLSAAVPTVGPFRPEGAYGVPWREHTRRTALILGLEERGEELIAELEAAYAEARAAHPVFAERTVTYCWPIEPDYYVYNDTDPRVQIVLELGLRLTDHALELAEENANRREAGMPISPERLDLLDADVIVAQSYGPERTAAEANRLFQTIPAVARGDLIWLPERVSDGLAFGTVLSTGAVLGELVELLATALET